MELTTATINSILLPPFLFFVTFCFLCCQLSLKSYTTATIGSKTEAETVTTTQSQDEPSTALEIQTLIEPAPARIQDKELQADLWETPVVEEPTKSEPNTLLVEDKEDVPVEQDLQKLSHQPSQFQVNKPNLKPRQLPPSTIWANGKPGRSWAH